MKGASLGDQAFILSNSSVTPIFTVMVEEASLDRVSVGTLFADRYELKSILGQGAMGKVFAAHDTVLNSTVALKVLNPTLSKDEAHLQRFLREVQLTRDIFHPNVVRTFDVGTVGALPYFTMEYVEGETLEKAIKSGTLTVQKSVLILKAITEALDAIHQKEVIHRDLKPANIILTGTGGIKLMDFGVARPQVSKLTANDELVGSATHMAPEIWRQAETTKKVDLYSLGVIAYEMLTGSLPFDGESAYEIMWKHLRHECTPPKKVKLDVPAWLDALVMELLKKEPKHRPASAKAVLNRLELQDLGESPHEKKPTPSPASSTESTTPNPFRTMLTRNALQSVRKKQPAKDGKTISPLLEEQRANRFKLIYLTLITMALAAIVWVLLIDL